MPLDPRICNVSIDANSLDGNDVSLDDRKRLLELLAQEKISLLVPHGVRTEISDPRTPADVRRDILPRIFTVETGLTSSERKTREGIRSALQGNAKPGKHDADAKHLAEAAKYGGYFITHDNRILKRSGQLADLLPPSLTVVTLAQFLVIYDEYEARRLEGK